MSELLTDPVYSRYLSTKPHTPPISRDKRMMKSPPWVVFVQREAGGSWGKKEFWKYGKALKFLMAWIDRGAHDAALHNKRIACPPPSRFVRVKGKYVVGSDGVKRQATKSVVWDLPVRLKLDQPTHYWCCYCRRPTVFKHFSKHKRLGTVNASVRRCTICGAGESIAMYGR